MYVFVLKLNWDFEVLRLDVCNSKNSMFFLFQSWVFLLTNRIITFNCEIFELTLNNLQLIQSSSPGHRF
jgi:hypothetical protein